MSLRKRLVLAMVAVFGCGAVLFYLLTTKVIIGGGADLEAEAVKLNLDRIKVALVTEEETMSAVCGDWAGWTETRDFIQGRNPGFPRENLGDTSVETLNYHFMHFFDRDRRLVLAKLLDPVTGAGREANPKLLEALLSHRNLFEHKTPKESKCGWIGVPGGAAMVCSYPITNNDFEMPIHGTLVVGRLWTLKQMRRFAAKLKMRIALLPLSQSHDPFEGIQVGEDRIEVMDHDTIEGRTVFADIAGNPLLSLRLDMSRGVMEHLRVSVRYLLLMMSFVGFGSLVVLLIGLDRLVIGPIKAMTTATESIARTGDRSRRLPVHKGEEFSGLSETVNSMLHSLEEAEQERFQAETRAQTSLRVQSLNVMAGSIAHKFNNLLQGIVGSLDLSLQQVTPEEEVREDLVLAKETAEKAIDLSHLMSTYVGEGPQRQTFIEPLVALGRVLEPYAQLTPAGVELEVDKPDNLPPMVGNEQQLGEMLEALLKNAVESFAGGGGKIEVRLGVRICDGDIFAACCFDDELKVGEYISLTVKDTGSGMDDETLQKLFDPFFTTRVIGRGLGMSVVLGIVRSHSGAIRVDSRPGAGTEVEILLPTTRMPVTSSSPGAGR